MSKIIRAISENGGIVMYAINSTDIVSKAEKVHKTSAVASAALGRLLTAATLMSSTLKSDKDSLTLRVRGDGPLGSILAVANGDGMVKGYVCNPSLNLPLREDGKLDVGTAVGKTGTLSIIKDMGLKEPYVGQTELVSGEIAEDITAYYAISEQTPTVCALGVLVNKDLSCAVAGGFIIQLLPGASDEEITRLESNIIKMQSVTTLLSSGKTIYDIIDIALAGFEHNILDESNAEYRCNCNKDKVKTALISLGRKELTDLINEGDNIHTKCEFCEKSYDITISKLLKSLED